MDFNEHGAEEEQEFETSEKGQKYESSGREQETESSEKGQETESSEREQETESFGKERETESSEKEQETESPGREQETESSEKGQEFEKSEKELPKKTIYPDYEDTGACRLKEAEAAYGLDKRQGEYTIEDYYALPEDVRAEFIDGWIYLMASPKIKHDLLGSEISEAIRQYIKKKKGRCIVLDSSQDVHVYGNDRAVLKPDVLVICNPSDIRNDTIYEAPDLIVEVLSPSTKKYDRTIKLRVYREAGVRECWLVDPKKEIVEVYYFRDRSMDVLPRVYTFDEVVPVGIYDGGCKVDFAEICRYIRFLYGDEKEESQSDVGTDS